MAARSPKPPRRRNRSLYTIVISGLLTLLVCGLMVLTWFNSGWGAVVIFSSLGTTICALLLGLTIALDDPNKAMFDVEPTPTIDMDDDGSRNSAGYQPGR